MSLPAAPSRESLEGPPLSVSANADPIRRSIAVRVSEPAPLVF
jgi:hypothetical protein